MSVAEILAKKRDGAELSTEEIRLFVSGVVDGKVHDYQAAAWLMAVYLRGMSRRETRDLTFAMRDSGEVVDLSDLDTHPTLDKHSTGGVGDKATLVVVPILVAAGIPMLKMSGRGLGHSGGTIDKLESIPGFRTALSVEAAKTQVKSIGAAMIGQSDRLAPADRIFYKLRDLTATVESIPLIASSIMSKKLAAGGERILLDVKVGRGAFMKTRDQAESLARMLIELGADAGIPTSAVLSAMDEPLGRTIGNALEVAEAVELLIEPDEGEPVFAAFCRELAGHGLLVTERASNPLQAGARVDELLRSGRPAAKFAEIVAAQGGPSTCKSILEALPRAPIHHIVLAPRPGTIVSIDAESVGRLAMEMGAGRKSGADQIDASVGVVLHRKVGSKVNAGDRLATMHMRSSDSARAVEFAGELIEAIQIAAGLVNPGALFWTATIP